MDIYKILTLHSMWLDDKPGGRRAKLIESDLCHSDLSGANLREANLMRADLSDADLRDANLRDANLRGADLSDARLIGASLIGASLSDADLSDANIIGASLSNADLSGANLRGAKFDAVYRDIPTTLNEVRSVILDNVNRLEMSCWHSDDNWRNGKAKKISDCGTAHCIAGWAHHLAALKRPELLDEKVNIYLVGKFALGDEAEEHFFDTNEDAIAWLESLDHVELTNTRN